MSRDQVEDGHEDEVSTEEESQIDFDTDILDAAPEPVQDDGSVPDEPRWRIANADLDNTLDEFIERVNARDLDDLSELLAPDAEADFLGEMNSDGIIDGLEDLTLRYPTLVVTRGDLGREPIVVAWLFDQGEDRYDLVGYFTVEPAPPNDGLIQRLAYIEELPETDELVVETPDKVELQEWEDWSTFEEG